MERRKRVHPHLGPKLAYHRRQAGLSQRKLGSISGIPFSQISRWERRKETPNYERVCALAAALDIPVSWLWDHTPAPDQSAETESQPSSFPGQR
jgi:transcriptional regulator with XRE-family HTH domain